MATNGIMKRRKRAQIGTILAILLILVPLPVGSMLVGNMNDFGTQEAIFSLNDMADDSIYDQDLVTYDNVSLDYTYKKYLDDGTTLLANYTSDVAAINLGYTNGTGDAHQADLSFSDSSKGVFFLLEQSPTDPAALLAFGVPMSAVRPNIGLVTTISPTEMLDAGITSARVYFENGQSDLNLTLALGVLDKDGIPNVWSGWSGYGVTGQEATDALAGAIEMVVVEDVVATANGSWVNIDIPASVLLTAATAHGDGYFSLAIVDVDGAELDETNGIFVDIELIGPTKPYSLTSTWNAMLIVTGLVGLFGALVSTPYVSLESLTGDGMQGKRYKKGYNPRGGKSRGGSSRKKGYSGNRNNRRR